MLHYDVISVLQGNKKAKVYGFRLSIGKLIWILFCITRWKENRITNSEVNSGLLECYSMTS